MEHGQMQDTRLQKKLHGEKTTYKSCKLKRPRSVSLSINLFLQQPIFIGRATFFGVRRMDAWFLSVLRFHDVFCLQSSYQHYLRKPLYQCLAFYSFFQNNNAYFGITVSNKLFSGIIAQDFFPFPAAFPEFSDMS